MLRFLMCLQALGAEVSFPALIVLSLLSSLVGSINHAVADGASARRVHGPIVTWDGDPATSMRVTWVEGEVIAGRSKVTSSRTWRNGQAGFGYGDDDDKTIIKDMKDNFSRVYIRHEFYLDDDADDDDADDDDKARLRIRYDDGFIAYLNGQEIARKEVKKGRGAEAKDVGSHEASDDNYRKIKIDDWNELAHEGKNVLAIEGHNSKKSSSDFTLDPYLTLNDEALIEKHETWAFLVGRDPGPNWTGKGFKPFDQDAAKRKEPTQVKNLNYEDVVYYRTVGTDEWFEATGSHRPFGDTNDIVRSVPLTGLEPLSDYEFVIGKKPSEVMTPLRFRTATDVQQEKMTFVTGGDMSASSTAREMNRLVGQLDPMFALLGGDLAYANGKNLKAWHKWLDAWRENAITSDGRIVPMVVAIGNHEMGSELDDEVAKKLNVPAKSQFFFSLFTLPTEKTNYALDFGDFLSLIVLDSDHSQDVEGIQTTWLKNTLRKRTRVPFRFVCYHRPVYGTAKDPNKDILENWVPLFERYAPTVVFENDHHTLKRTHRIRDGKVDPTGVLYLGDGAWGVKTRDVPKPGEEWHLATAAKENHLWLVTIEGDGVLCQALDEHGKELDKVRINASIAAAE